MIEESSVIVTENLEDTEIEEHVAEIAGTLIKSEPMLIDSLDQIFFVNLGEITELSIEFADPIVYNTTQIPLAEFFDIEP